MALRTRSKTRSEPGPGRFVDVDVPGFTGRVRLREDGPPGADVLVLLHGFSGSLHWFDRVAPLLDDVYHLVRVDLLGHGATGGPPADAPLQAAVVEAVLAELDLENVTALGHSFGADVAVELAERSSRVARLIIVTQAPDYSDANLPRAGVLMTRPVLAVGAAPRGRGARRPPSTPAGSPAAGTPTAGPSPPARSVTSARCRPRCSAPCW